MSEENFINEINKFKKENLNLNKINIELKEGIKNNEINNKNFINEYEINIKKLKNKQTISEENLIDELNKLKKEILILNEDNI